jgi:triacylglycerol lipase
MTEPRTVVQDAGERPSVLRSRVHGPLRELTFLRRALALAELAMISYNDEAEARTAAAAMGFPEAALFDNDGPQAFRFRNAYDCVVACRGTEPDEWNDLKTDANAALAVVGAVGKVHSGFNTEVDDLWPMLEDLLRDNDRPVWFCGHSLGGAMATICAARCIQSSLSSNPEELHTFGSPRVGCKRYMRQPGLRHYRWVHNTDVVTRVRIRKLTGLERSRGRRRGRGTARARPAGRGSGRVRDRRPRSAHSAERVDYGA